MDVEKKPLNITGEAGDNDGKELFLQKAQAIVW
jgi:hypothetical protein